MPTPKVVVPKFTAWSYSRLKDWEKCPRFAKYKHLDKRKEPDSGSQARGSAIHKEAEKWATKDPSLKKMPESLECFKGEFTDLRRKAKTLITEGQIGLASDWTITDWFDSDAREHGMPLPWCRVVMDLRFTYLKKGRGSRQVKVMKIVDHKTGKVREENEDQLSLYALAGFSLEPTVDMVETELWYLDQGIIQPENPADRCYTPDEVPKMKKDWEGRVAGMMADTTFKPKPADQCRWCYLSKTKGGPCEF